MSFWSSLVARGLRALPVFVAASLGASASGCYELRQASGQLELFLQRRSVASVLGDRDLDASQRDRLRVLWFARDFALRELGLNASESYQAVVRLDRSAVSYVVAASPPDRVEAYRWCFPFAGCLPYIGYFSRRDAIAERDRLRALGYDTQLRGVDAYSLGGWFPDPVYSPLLTRTRGSIANTVIHELTHGTIFVPGEGRFNESVATFVGDRGARLFLERRYGAGSATVREALAFERDIERWDQRLTALADELRAMYARPITRDEKLRRKRAIIDRALREMRRGLFETTPWQRRVERFELNNADLATHATYSGDRALLERAFVAHGGDLRAFIAFLRSSVAPHRAPAAWLEQWTRERTSRADATATARSTRR